MKKLILAIFVCLVALAGLVSAISPDYNINDVYVNDILADGKNVQVELDTKLTVEVHLEGTGNTKDVKLKAWIGGYEYDLLEDYTEMFDMEEGISYRKTLEIEIPEDLIVQDNYYTLHVELYDDNNIESEEFTIYFEEPRHKIDVKDIIVLESNDNLGIKLRLTNLGENKEEDIRVTVSIPDLGISARTYIDELAARNQETEDLKDEITTQTLYLQLPNGVSGDYELMVQVDYNNDHTTTEDSTMVRLNGFESFDDSARVSISTLNNLKVGKEAEFKIQITNLEDAPKTFYMDVEGDFEIIYTEQATVSNTQVFTVKVTPLTEGLQTLNVKVYTNEGTVAENTYNYDVTENTKLFPIIWGVLAAVFVIFIALFIIRRVR